MKKLHYYLVTAEVFFVTASQETGSVRVNALVMNDHRQVPLHLIGKAQQSAQLQFFKKLNDATVQVLDVVIANLSYLGLMSEKEFKVVPDGLKLQEMPAGSNPFSDPTSVN